MLEKIEKSDDGTIKLNFKDGFHCVIIPQKNNKKTLCISSQVGCAMGCEFCLTAKMGFIRNLSKEEIINQFRAALEYLNEENLEIMTQDKKKGKIYAQDLITSIVYMGQGEPFNNYNNLCDSIEYLNQYYSYPFKKITVSTSGIVPKMKDFIKKDWKVHLALSFHSPFQERRDLLMPYLSKWKIEDLVELCNEYSKKFRDKIMVEYIMIKGLTDRNEDLEKLLSLGFISMTNFNLIPLNGTMKIKDETFFPSDKDTLDKFHKTLRDHGFKCFTRHNMGEDIEAACGMLSQKN